MSSLVGDSWILTSLFSCDVVFVDVCKENPGSHRYVDAKEEYF
jgi:hypothetical protein